MNQRRDAVRAAPADLLAQVARGDREALRALHVRRSNRLFGLALAMLRDRTIASDVLQQGFVEIWHGARHFDPAVTSAEVWMAAIIRHAALGTARVRGRERPLDGAALAGVAIDPDGIAALAHLEAAPRRAMVLAYVHGLSIPELAGCLAVPPDRALSLLREGLSGLSTNPAPRDALAGEHVLGVIDARAAAEVNVLQRADPALRDPVAGWERCLAPLSLLTRPESPPPNLWERIAERIGRVEPPRIRQRRRTSALVLAWAIAASLLAAGLAGFIAYPRTLPPRLVATLGNDRNLPGVLLESDRTGGLRITALNALTGRALQAPGGKTFHLWALLPGKPAAVSVAVLPHEMPRQMSIPAPSGTLPDDAVLQISLENEGGSRTGAPSGPIIYMGRLSLATAADIEQP